MHGLINRAMQSFFTYTYGSQRWRQVVDAAELGFTDFEPMLIYEDEVSLRVLQMICAELDREQSAVLEDLGTFLVSHPELEALRRLLRFGGVTYVELLHSMDDLHARARLAVDDLNLPRLELCEHGPGQFSLKCMPGIPGFGSVMMGVLRTMADDYGALAMLDHNGQQDGCEVIEISLIETAFSEGRSFELGASSG